MTDDKQHIQIHISGRVQGVGFRYSALHMARQLGVKGFVRNTYDGAVFIEAEGTTIALEQFKIWCNKGPSFARVQKVDVTEGSLKHYTSFTIKH